MRWSLPPPPGPETSWEGGIKFQQREIEKAVCVHVCVREGEEREGAREREREREKEREKQQGEEGREAESQGQGNEQERGQIGEEA